MKKVEEAKQILEALGLPEKQQNELAALTLLSLAHIKKRDKWSQAKQVSMSVVGSRQNSKYKGIMRFISQHYNKNYAENTRESIRRQILHQFLQAGIINHNPENPQLPTNSKDNHYRLTPEALKLIKAYGTKKWSKEAENFEETVGSLRNKYAKQRELRKIPVKLPDGTRLKLSPGNHNVVQIAIVKEFGPRFAPESDLLYLGDTAKKDLYLKKEQLEKLNIPIDQHSKLPDVVLFDPDREWLFLIEAVTSHGPISPKRVIELEDFLKNCKAGKIYVTAFPDFQEFKRHTNNIAWETEVWVVEAPDHMIHFNGDKFMGPR